MTKFACRTGPVQKVAYRTDVIIAHNADCLCEFFGHRSCLPERLVIN